MAIVIHTIKGNQYAYNHHREGKKVICDYLGREGGGGSGGTPQTQIPQVTQQTETTRLSSKYSGVISSVRSKGLKEDEETRAKDDLLKYMGELPEKDLKNIGIVIFDWGSEKRGEAIQDSLPESYWDEKGREQARKDYNKLIKKHNKSALLFNPIWGKDDRLERSTVYHEMGHTLFHHFSPSDSDVVFWNQQANKYGWEGMTDEIIKKYPTHTREGSNITGRGSLVREYIADHYAAYHLKKEIPTEEIQWFDNRYR